MLRVKTMGAVPFESVMLHLGHNPQELGGNMEVKAKQNGENSLVFQSKTNSNKALLIEKEEYQKKLGST